MKNKIAMAGLSIIMVLLIIGIARRYLGTKPLKNLMVADVKSIAVTLRPPEITIELNSEEKDKAIELLNEIIVYQKRYISDATTGQVIAFVITKGDGTQINADFSGNTVLSLNNISYRLKYEEGEKLSAFANSLREQK